MATDQVSFFDEPLKKQIEGYFVSDGREIHVSISYGALGPVIDYNSQVLLVRKLLSELAREPSGSRFKELRKPHPALGSRNGNKSVTVHDRGPLPRLGQVSKSPRTTHRPAC